MAGGAFELVGIPSVYAVRHLPPRRKRAHLSAVYEETPVRLPSWSGDEAPLVGEVRVAHVENAPEDVIAYRAARGADGVVRLVAPVASDAFEKTFNANEVEGRVPLTARTMFRSERCGHADPVPPGEWLGQVIASDRASARARTADLARRLVLVDGVLHAPCPPPGWHLHTDESIITHPERDKILRIVARPDPISAGYYCDRFAPWRPGDLRHDLGERYPATQWPVPTKGSICEFVPEALRSDLPWRALRDKMGKVLRNDERLPGYLLEEEAAMRRTLMAAYKDWPPMRSASLATACARMARIVHGEKAVDNAAMLEAVLAAVAALERTPAPPPLETRLARAGVILPHLPEASRGHASRGAAPEPDAPRP